MPDINYQKIRDDSKKIEELADEIAEVLKSAGLAQPQGTYKDARCEKIKQLSREMSNEAGAGTGN